MQKCFLLANTCTHVEKKLSLILYYEKKTNMSIRVRLKAVELFLPGFPFS